MELALIIAGLLALVAGLAVVVSWALRVVARHRRDLAAAGMRAARPHAWQMLASREPLAVWIRSRAAPGWLFSISVATGLSAIAASAVVMATVVDDVTDGDGVAVLDRPVAAFVATHRSGALTAVMRAASSAGGPVVLAVVTVAAGVLAAVLWRSWGPVVVAGVTTAGGAALTAVFKEVLGRPRPPMADAVAAADGYAFPSGHAAVAVAALGVLAYLGTARLRSWAGRVVAWAAAAVLAALVGISRVYLGVHWTTDVIGGWAFGACWLALVITGWTALTRYLAAGGLPAASWQDIRAQGRRSLLPGTWLPVALGAGPLSVRLRSGCHGYGYSAQDHRRRRRPRRQVALRGSWVQHRMAAGRPGAESPRPRGQAPRCCVGRCDLVPVRLAGSR